jgi:glutamate dehydrogenase/leucine dehydrogenase
VQGWGNVGSFFTLVAEAEHQNWKLVAATDSSGGVYDSKGYSAKELDDYKKSGGKLNDYRTGRKISNEDLIGLDVDVLVMAALEDAVNDKNADENKAKVVLELANGPVSYDAYKKLSDKDISVIPDILANSGGVIVSYLEWVQNKKGEHWAEHKVNAELEKYLVSAADKVYERYQSDKLTLKEAAFAEAITKLTA